MDSIGMIWRLVPYIATGACIIGSVAPDGPVEGIDLLLAFFIFGTFRLATYDYRK